MKNIIIILLLLITSTIYAQDCSAYDNLIAEGNIAFSNGNYERAVKRYNLAMLNCPEKITDVQEKILGVFKEVEQLKEAANQQKIIAESEKKQAEIARDSAKKLLNDLSIEKAKTDSILLIVEAEQAKNERIINSLYFYEDSLALASKDTIIISELDTLIIIKYGFIDTLGNPIIRYKYDEASSFDELGYAKVKLNGYDYLLDTKGNEYRLANDVTQLSSNILALDLRGKQINKLPPVVYKNTQLKILILPDENPVSFSLAIKNMTNLEIFESGISRTSSEIENLPNLKALNRTVLQRPNACERPTMEDYRYKKIYSGGSNNGIPWIVYSNQADNPTYQSPQGAEYKKMGFMDAFYVVDETVEYLRLVSYLHSRVDKSRRTNIKDAVDYGWVPKDKLLLCWNSLISGQNNSLIRGIVNREFNPVGNDDKRELVFYNSPTLEKNSQNDRNYSWGELLYIFDQKNDNYLVGSENRLTLYNIKRKLIGWVKGEDILLLNTRYCLKPNSAPQAVAERKAKNIEMSIFADYQAAERYKSGGKNKNDNIIWSEYMYEEKKSWSSLIFVLEADKKGIYKTVVMNNNLYNNEEEKTIEKVEKASVGEDDKIIQMFIEGYTPSNVDELEYPLFEVGIFIDEIDLIDLHYMIERVLHFPSTKNEEREAILEIYRAIFMFHYGYDFRNASYRAIEQKISEPNEFPLISNLLNSYSINDLKNPEKVSDFEIKKIYHYLTNKNYQLEKILRLGERHPSCYQNDNINRYYFLSEDLP